MNINFQIKPLEKTNFSRYFKMTDSQLAEAGAYLFTADQCPWYPCRVSLCDAQLGESVLAISIEHHQATGPYRSSGPVFVRQNAETAKLEPNEIPELLRHRQLSVRGYSNRGLMVEADTVAGKDLEQVLSLQLNNSAVEYMHIHNAGAGCFNCAVVKA